jgi:hypothetical protein
MEKLGLIFSREKKTKNTIQYQEELGDEAHSSKDIAVGTLYVQREALGQPVPQRLKGLSRSTPMTTETKVSRPGVERLEISGPGRLSETQRLVLVNVLRMEKGELLGWGRYRSAWSGGQPWVLVRRHIFQYFGNEKLAPSLRASYSRSLQRLEKRGYIVRLNDINRRSYVTHVALTEAGREIAELLAGGTG